MTKQTWGLNASLYDYYQAIAFREPDILKELRQATSQLPMANMQIAPEQGQFMALLVQLTGARKILEIGVFTGYSSLAMALALPPQGRVLGCEISAEYAAIARQFWQKAGVSEKIDVLLGPAVTSLEQLLANGEQESFDLAFIDANKRGRKSQSMTVPSIYQNPTRQIVQWSSRSHLLPRVPSSSVEHNDETSFGDFQGNEQPSPGQHTFPYNRRRQPENGWVLALTDLTVCRALNEYPEKSTKMRRGTA